MPILGGQHSSKHLEKEKMRPWWIDPCFVIVGAACDWYLAFEWFSEKYPLFSGAVIRAAVLVVVLCALVAVVLARVYAGKVRESVGAFFVISVFLLTNMLLEWATRR
jgi:hypothetical protein